MQKKDLVTRLRKILKVLRDDEDIEADNNIDYPGLAALCQALVRPNKGGSSGSSGGSSSSLLEHRDKEVRLYTVCCCMELFTIYAPQAPWNHREVAAIFQQTIRQLANLAHTVPWSSSTKDGTTTTQQQQHPNTHFYQYYRILELMAEVKIGVILVDIYNVSNDSMDDNKGRGRTNRSSSRSSRGSHCHNSPNSKLTVNSNGSSDDDTHSDDDAATLKTHHSRKSLNTLVGRKEALDVLCELFRTLLGSVRTGHPPEIADYSQKALVACVEEFFDNSATVPVPILDELLFCIGQGPRVLVLHQPQQLTNQGPSSATTQQTQKNNKRQLPGSGTKEVVGAPPVKVAVNNPSFMVATAVLRRSVERLSHPIASLLSGLVDSSHRQMAESTISNLLEDNEEDANNSDDDGVQADDAAVEDEATTPAKKAKGGKASKKRNSKAENRRKNKLQRLLYIVDNLGLPQLQQQSQDDSTSNVWSIIYQMNKVAPSILTTVIGHLQNHLGSSNFTQRILVVQTLGKLFTGSSSCSSSSGTTGGSKKDGALSDGVSLALEYAPCYRTWLLRNYDANVEIRRIMIPHLLTLAKSGGALGGGGLQTHQSSVVGATDLVTDPKAEVAREAQMALKSMLDKDPEHELRLQVSQGLCDMSIRHRHILTKDLILEVRNQVMVRGSEKNRLIERRSALTGLVQTYHRQYLKHHLHNVLEGGDDCPIEAILQVLNETCQSGPAVTSMSRSRSSSLTPKKTPSKRGRSKRKSKDDDDSDDDDDGYEGWAGKGGPVDNNADYSYYQWIPSVLFETANTYKDADDAETHSRVVALVDDMILGSDMPHLKKKYHLTATARAVGLAIVVNSIQSHSNKAWVGMERMLRTRANLQKALKAYLNARGEMRSHAAGSEDAFEADAKAMGLLEKVAAMLPPPPGAAPAPGERHAVLEKFNSIKDKHVFRILGTITYPNHSVKARARAVDELPKRVKTTAGDAAQAWVKTLAKRCTMGEFMNQGVVDHCLTLAQECFEEEQFGASQYFLTCLNLAANIFPELCASKETFGGLTELFQACSSSVLAKSRKQGLEKSEIVTTLSAILAGASQYRSHGQESGSKSEDFHKHLITLCREGTPEQARHAVKTLSADLKPQGDGVLTQEQTDAFLPLLKLLASPSRLALEPTVYSSNLVCVLSVLAELAEQAPSVFASSHRGEQALGFALEVVLLGRSRSPSKGDGSDDDGDSDEDSSDDENEQGDVTKTPSQRRRSNKSGRTPTSHLSPSISKNPVDDTNLSTCCRMLCAAIEFLAAFVRSAILASGARAPVVSSNHQLIDKLFDTLSKILRDEGMAPSSRDRKACALRQCRAALRQTAAIWLFRLCDTRLGLDQKFLTTERWHILGGVLLDDEATVRESVMDEFGSLLTGTGMYGKHPVRLRLLAYLSLCLDDNASNSAANGGAANVGRACLSAKKNGLRTVVALRHVYEASFAEARARGEEYELKFETSMKPTILPEYVLPSTVSLLTFRNETPTTSEDQAGMRVVKKRLKNVLEPLVTSLGDNADNISFLLRCCEVLSTKVPVGGAKKELSKMKLVCGVVREVLLSLVRSDINLATFPGSVYMPQSLFKNAGKKRKSRAPDNDDVSLDGTSSRTSDSKRRKNAASNYDDSSDDEIGGLDSKSKGSSPAKTTADGNENESLDAGSFVSRKETSRSVASPSSPQESVGTRRSGRSTKKNATESDAKSSTPGSDGKSFAFDSSQEHQTPKGSTTSKGREARSSTSKGSVRFSLDEELSPIGSSPIRSKTTPTGSKANSFLLDSDEKTRGATPPSGMKPFSATASAAFENSGSTEATPVSASTAAKSPEQKRAIRHRRRRTSDQEKENSTNSKTGRSRSLPKKIRVVRGKSPKLKVQMSKCSKQPVRVSRTRKAEVSDDPFEF